MDRSLLLLVIFPLGVLCQTIEESGPGMVKPSDQLRVTCTVSGFELTSYHVSWIRQTPGGPLEWIVIIWNTGATAYAESMKSRLSITRDTAKKVVTLQMTSMEAKDSGTYYCARYNWSFDIWGKGTFVTVTSAEKRAPSVFPLLPSSRSLSTSQDVTFGCLSIGYLPAPVDVTWNSGSITSGIRKFPDVLSKSGTYSSTSLLTVSAEDYKSKKYTCNVNHKATSQEIKNIDFIPKLKEPTVEVMQSPCGKSGPVDLVCLVSGYFPDDINIQWLLNEKPTSIPPRNSTSYKDSDGNFVTRSDVRIPRAKWNSTDFYTCKVTHPPTKTTKLEKIHKCPECKPMVTLLPPSPQDIHKTNKPKVICEVSKLESAESLSITWSRSDNKTGQTFNSDPEKDPDGKMTVTSTMAITVEDWNSGITFTCTVQHNHLPSPVEKIIFKTNVIYPEIFIFPPPKNKIDKHDFFGVHCLLRGGSLNDVYVQWKQNGGKALDRKRYSISEPIKDYKETDIIYSRLSISKDDWEDGATFTCCSDWEMKKCGDLKLETSNGNLVPCFGSHN